MFIFNPISSPQPFSIMFEHTQHNTKILGRTISGDPIATQIYTLKNGLKLFLSVNKDEPRVYSEIAVRAGSKHDPADTTGLAHYFEHMMFKGTDRLGSLDWEQEKPLLDKIERLFEAHRAEQDSERKKALYAEIDRTSFQAAGFAAANEYDKLVSAMGATNTNAYTWVEQTVYVNDVPTTELERWFALESERFRRPILRLFHTELETVFEEYNINQDRDFRKTLKAMQAALTPTHPYGTQTTLGRGEDLKNPSQSNIYRFFDQYYVPNNMAIVLCGDFDPDRAVALAEQYFGKFQAKPVPPFRFEPQPPLTTVVRKEVFGNEESWIDMGWRLEGAKSEEARILPLIAGILQNAQAGLFDLNLIQTQKVLETYAYPSIYEDYSSLMLQAKPREGQSLEDVEQLLLTEIEKLRTGTFEDWLPQAVVKDLKVSEIREFEHNKGRAAALTATFILGLDWGEMVQRWDYLSRITKEDVMAFAQKHLRNDNFVAIYKRTGEDKTVIKVEKPPITAIEVNRTDSSLFAQTFLQQQTQSLEPVFVDFKKTIRSNNLGKNLKLRSVQDPSSPLFRLYYIYDLGKLNDRRLGILAEYLPYLGTDRYTATQMHQAFYRLGVSFAATCQDERLFLTVSGLEESFEEAVKLMEHLLANAQPNPEALQNLIEDVLLQRENEKLDKRTILSHGMFQYAKYGPVSPFTDKLSKEKLLAVQPAEIIDLLKDINSVQHEIFYNGPRSPRSVVTSLKKYHPGAQQEAPLKDIKTHYPLKKYPEIGTRRDKVFFAHFPMVQVELMLVSKGTPRFSLEEYAFSEWYNQYFGYGLSSIVFQEIRESKALAYSAYTFAASPNRKNRANFLRAYVGTQPDKLREAIDAFQEILEKMPVSLPQIENARQGVLRQIAAERLVKADIYWHWRSSRDKGFANRDLRADIYNFLQHASAADLIRYQKEHIQGRSYTWLVLGDRERIDFEYLKKIGPVKELTLEQIFGY